MPLVNRKPKIFIDFDGTLFDTAAFRDALFALFLRLGYSRSEIIGAYMEECADYQFSPKDMYEKLARTHSSDRKDFNLSLGGLFVHSFRYLYDDSVAFLQTLRRRGYETNLLSMGDIRFQKSKVENSRLADHFDNIYYCDTKKSQFLIPIVGHSERFIFLDDRVENIADIEDHFPDALAIEINRRRPDLIDPTRGNRIVARRTIDELSGAFRYMEHYARVT